mmetsp:Transcript_30805/g.27254  ORF Transcript_30805/g.27254 Transcript_30805/m.27254 type:complete len:113 (-) Transcript_30805:111-449(-)
MHKEVLKLSLKNKLSQRLKMEQEKQTIEISRILRKKEVRKYYLNKYSLKISHKSYLKMNEKKLHTYFLQKHKKKNLKKSVVIIQKNYRGYIARKKHKEHQELIQSSATRIQK